MINYQRFPLRFLRRFLFVAQEVLDPGCVPVLLLAGHGQLLRQPHHLLLDEQKVKPSNAGFPRIVLVSEHSTLSVGSAMSVSFHGNLPGFRLRL